MSVERDILDSRAREAFLSQVGSHVWAAAFVANLDGGHEAAATAADAAVAALEQVRRAAPEPLEGILASSGLAVSEEEFYGWYRVCSGLRRGIEVQPTAQELRDAYISYSRCRTDFY